MKRWNRGVLIAVIVAIATATGLLNQPRATAPARAAGPVVELTYSIQTASLEVRAGVFTLEIDL